MRNEVREGRDKSVLSFLESGVCSEYGGKIVEDCKQKSNINLFLFLNELSGCYEELSVGTEDKIRVGFVFTCIEIQAD